MKRSLKKIGRYSVILFLLVFFAGIWIPRLEYGSERSRLSEDILSSEGFRRQTVSGEAMEQVRKMDAPGEALAVYWLESNFGQEPFSLLPDETAAARKRWERAKGWGSYLAACQAVWDDLQYFPVAESSDNGRLSVSFEDSWMFDRSYGGERGHEGTDIMPSVNEPGRFPVVSMTDGIVESKGWLELGGYRLGIRAPHGAYFYYAHLDSYADIEEGDTINAGDLLGFMGDTGYGTEEGTRGKFPVHLHVGIYLYQNEQEISVNPYPALSYVQDKKVSGDF
ncbi:M23 family metallopeptidase [[Ruminococcus] torques]|uniref:M23 family metallopeptidase n=1 Tax=[Ruminococcus] torques TaxID=33039 RepID=UPI0025A3B7BD|nr:M23 family metallopeptidase [[Ruminococcus] torques]MDM8235668.1 M23 family metallopeptidase [[Ruminococcus] torques]